MIRRFMLLGILPAMLLLAAGHQLYASGATDGCSIQKAVSLDPSTGGMIESDEWVCPVAVMDSKGCARATLQPITLARYSPSSW